MQQVWPPSTALGLGPKFAVLSAGLIAGYLWYRRSSAAATDRQIREIESYLEVVSGTVYDFSAVPSSVPSVADVVFLHGIGGSHVFDYCDYDATKSSEHLLDGIWMRKLLPAALNKPVRVLSLRIDYSALFASQSRPVLDEIAAHLLHCLSLVGVGVGHRPLVLICRDIGGIIAKAIICHAQNHPAYKSLYCNIAGEDRSSDKNSYQAFVQALCAKMGPMSAHLLFLIQELNRTFFLQQPNFLYHTVGPMADDVFPLRFMLQMSGTALRYVPIANYDHATACKPTNARDIRLLTITSFINEVLSFGNYTALSSYAKQ